MNIEQQIVLLRKELASGEVRLNSSGTSFFLGGEQQRKLSLICDVLRLSKTDALNGLVDYYWKHHGPTIKDAALNNMEGM
ncbi:hypothetical protein LX64_03656 [Chitinophaga skermanii]|uniref:Uncharacterized protein n=1 Tax=Chitinophaga skermanii TaxID=331697 RepID=A0A327QDA0_9BACT|nr:hypothetical protein [Chitinophaga skermanii]RAJ02636.1 hypothetical protein LX64_03656 [Chitinophaga skermanii]